MTLNLFRMTLLLFPVLLLAAGDETEIRQVLTKQQELWNAGDSRGFSAYYTEDTRFVSTQIQRGRKQVEERYARKYPTREAMGQLTFDELEITRLGKDYASVIGRWKLDRSEAAGGNVGGYYTLLFKRTKQGWKIILDHTS